MNGSENIKLVIDTNIIFMSLYNPESKAGLIIEKAIENKIILYSPDSVKQELKKVLKRELGLLEEEIKQIINSLPIIWIEKEIYLPVMDKTNVKHKPDKPIEALAIILNCRILTADTDFNHIKQKINVNEILEELKE